MPQINVAPARDGLLVPFEAARRGEFIGMRHARKDEPFDLGGEGGQPSAKLGAGHGYVKSETPYAVVEASAYYTRRIKQGDLVELSAEDVAKLIAAQHAREAAASAEVVETVIETTTTTETVVTVEVSEDTEQPATRRARSGR